MTSVDVASNNEIETVSYFDAIRFNFSVSYYFGWLPKKLAIYMLYLFLGALLLVLNPFTGLYQATAAVISNSTGVISQELLNRFITIGVVTILFTFELRQYYKYKIKTLSRFLGVDLCNSLRNVSQTLVYNAQHKINLTRKNDKGEKAFIENTGQNYSSGSRDVFGKCDYFLQSMFSSIFQFVVVTLTLGPEIGLLSFGIFSACLVIANIVAYFWAKYSLAEVIQQNASNKNFQTRCISLAADCKSKDELITLARENAKCNKTAKEELAQTSKLDFIRGLIDSKFTHIIVTIVLISAGVSTDYPLLVWMAGQIADLIENGIPLLSQAQTMAQLRTTYNWVNNHFNYLRVQGAIPNTNPTDKLHISDAEFCMLYLENEGNKQPLKDITNTVQLTSSLAFVCFSLYQYLGFLGAYEIAYVMPQLFPSIFSLFASIFSLFASTATAHLMIIAGFILIVTLAGAIINAGISLVSYMYQTNKAAHANKIHVQPGYRSALRPKPSQSMRILFSFQHFIPNNSYNPIFATTWAFPILVALTKISALATPIFSIPFLTGFIALSVLLSAFANTVLTPSHKEYKSFVNRINANASFSFSPLRPGDFQGISPTIQSGQRTQSALDFQHKSESIHGVQPSLQATTNAGKLREIAHTLLNPPLSSSEAVKLST